MSAILPFPSKHASVTAANVIALPTPAHASVRTTPTVDAEWWLNVLSWVDWTDITTHKRNGYVFFMDMLINRPTEFAVMLALFVRAYERCVGRLEMTAAQVEAVTLAYEAVAAGMNPARYVASKKGTSLRAAYYLLKRADTHIEKMFNFPQKTYTPYREKNYLPSEAQIQRQMAKYRRPCPCKDLHDDCVGMTRGDRDLCHPCSKRYGLKGERPDWLEKYVQSVRSEYRERALADLMELSVAYDDDFDALLNERAETWARRAA